ncbi:hypothetical protein [Peterkaempfera griseoplana]|uniref:hypothetical protein n=1 Tax=Peterkaempfera griseoplana TaxID=66896 RepID=UPI0006E172D0|nr:hypothetical protein [Peterkaempfera griseoplana]
MIRSLLRRSARPLQRDDRAVDGGVLAFPRPVPAATRDAVADAFADACRTPVDLRLQPGALTAVDTRPTTVPDAPSGPSRDPVEHLHELSRLLLRIAGPQYADLPPRVLRARISAAGHALADIADEITPDLGLVHLVPPHPGTGSSTCS